MKPRANARSLVLDIRRARAMTQAALAASVGVNRSTVSAWEHGSIPGVDSYGKLVRMHQQLTMLPLEDSDDGHRSDERRSRPDLR